MAKCHLPDALIADGHWARSITRALGVPEAEISKLAQRLTERGQSPGAAGKASDYELDEVVVTADFTFRNWTSYYHYANWGRIPSDIECMAGPEGTCDETSGGGSCYNCSATPAPETPPEIDCSQIEGVINANRAQLRGLYDQSRSGKKEYGAIISPTSFDPNLFTFYTINSYSEQTACRARYNLPSNIPNGSILVHSHPFVEGEQLFSDLSNWNNACLGQYGIDHSISDRGRLQAIGEKLASTKPNPTILAPYALIVDGNGIIAYDGQQSKRCSAW